MGISRKWSALLLALVLILAFSALALAQADKVTVTDQAISNNTVTIQDVKAAADGWIVIHAQANGNPGPDIGHAAVKAGDNPNVVVTIDPTKATPVLYAMLHIDAGTKGTYEFPGADTPVQGAAADVNPTFNITGLPAAAGTPAATTEATATTAPAATAAATEAATAAATTAATETPAATTAAAAAAGATPAATAAAPGALPTTGGDSSSLWLVVLAASVVVLGAGFGLSRRRAG